jgi:hypothetical protein
MGWSCSAKASDVMNAWNDFCFKSSGLSNVFKDKGKTYLIEYSNREHDDGSITGTILVSVGWNLHGNELFQKTGSFKINGDGTIARAPAALKKVKVTFREFRGIGSNG